MFGAIKRWMVGKAIAAAKEYVTVNRIAEWSMLGANALIEKAAGEVEPARMARICATCSKASALCGTLADALADKVITPEETVEIMAAVKAAFDTSVLTDAQIAGWLDALGEELKKRV